MNRPLRNGTLAIGELGLGGEIRSVPQLEHRLREASRLGLGHAIIPPIGPKHAENWVGCRCWRSDGCRRRWRICELRQEECRSGFFATDRNTDGHG